MATPLVTGCVALIRDALQDQGKTRPSAALVKALLINGAVNCSDKSGRGFDYQQGFGRVHVDSSIAMVKQAIYGGFVAVVTNLTQDVTMLTGYCRPTPGRAQPFLFLAVRTLWS
jgi:hypothetical protein